MAARVDVRKTYKLYIGGAFPRSESGRSYEVYAASTRPGAASSVTPSTIIRPPAPQRTSRAASVMPASGHGRE